MKKLSLLLSIFVVTILVSCGDDSLKQVKSFATDVAQLVSKNRLDSLRMFYKDAFLFDSLALKFCPDSIYVKELKDGNSYFVGLGNSADITLAKDSNENMIIISSHGLIAYDKQTMDFAKKTGQWKEGLTDSELAERMNDKDFEKSLIENIEKEFVKNLSITHEVPDGDFESNERESIYIIKNNSSMQIDGSDYQLIIPFFEEQHFGDPNPKRWDETRKGKTIAPNGKVSYIEYIVTERGDFTRTGPVFDGHHIDITLNGKALFNKYTETTGDEYEKYLKKTKGNVQHSNSQKTSTLETKQTEIINFIIDFYNKHKYEDEDFLNKHCSSNLLKKLQTSNEYEGDGLATWIFRSDTQDGPSERHEIIKVEPLDNDWYKYDFYDMGVRCSHEIKVVSHNGQIQIEDLK